MRSNIVKKNRNVPGNCITEVKGKRDQRRKLLNEKQHYVLNLLKQDHGDFDDGSFREEGRQFRLWYF